MDHIIYASKDKIITYLFLEQKLLHILYTSVSILQGKLHQNFLFIHMCTKWTQIYICTYVGEFALLVWIFLTFIDI